eukprot:scaffold96005_cov59-Attheya_sp.AAC.1
MVLSIRANAKIDVFNGQCRTNLDADRITSRIETMRIQEETKYRCRDYLELFQEVIEHDPLSFLGPQCPEKPVDQECRVKMVDWCYQVVDFCKFERETVTFAMSFLDRFLLTPRGHAALLDRKEFQLAAMTCLYTAVKLHEPEVMEPRVISLLSRGSYSEESIIAMEASILGALDWRVNTPTSWSFVQHFMSFLPSNVTPKVRRALLEQSQYQVELAVIEYKYINTNPSSIALAAIHNAMDAIGHEHVDNGMFLQTVAKISGIDLFSGSMKSVQIALLLSFARSAGCSLTVSTCIRMANATSKSSWSINSEPDLEQGNSNKLITNSDRSPRCVASRGTTPTSIIVSKQ